METTSKHKRALFSCDRCKLKKVACHRFKHNEPCALCQVAGSECKTTIARKKRKVKPILETEKMNQHLMAIVKHVYPKAKLDSSNSILQFAQSMNIHISKDDIIMEKSHSLESDLKEEDPKQMVYTGKFIDGFGYTNNKQGKYDRIIYDIEGIPHYVGPFGFANSLTMLLNTIISKTKKKDLNSIQFITSRNRKGSIISSFPEPINPHILEEADFRQFPYFCFFDKKEADFYVEVFFGHSNRVLSCVDRDKFLEDYERYWQILSGDDDVLLSHARVCCIYTIWIIGITIKLYPEALMQDTYELVNKFITIIKLLLSDMCICPSIDGIRCLTLLATFFERNMQLESAYFLGEMAVRHGMSCGFHRESVISSYSDPEEIASLWWTIFDNELRLCSFLDRASTVPLNQVNLTAMSPQLVSPTRRADILMTELNRVVYDSTCYKNSLLATKNLGLEANSAKAMDIYNKLHAIQSYLKKNFKGMEDLKIEQDEVMIRYHYYLLCFTLPFLLWAISLAKAKIENDSSLWKIVTSCIISAMSITNILIQAETRNHFSCLEFLGMSIAKTTMLAFVAGYLVMNKNFTNDINLIDLAYLQKTKGVSPESLVASTQALREVNLRRIGDSTGTLRIMCFWVEVLNRDFDLLRNLLDHNNVVENILDSIESKTSPASSTKSTNENFVSPTSITTTYDINFNSRANQFLVEKNFLTDLS